MLLVLLAWGCSGADDAGQPAAQQAVAELLSTSGFRIDSPIFQEKVRPYVRIPEENTCYGENVSPTLEWTEAPEGTESFALVAEDADHHTGTWVLWVLYNIPPDVTGGYVNRCVNDIRRRPFQPLIQWRFHPHTVHRGRRLRSTQGPSDA